MLHANANVDAGANISTALIALRNIVSDREILCETLAITSLINSVQCSGIMIGNYSAPTPITACRCFPCTTSQSDVQVIYQLSRAGLLWPACLDSAFA